jgi:cytochrome P450
MTEFLRLAAAAYSEPMPLASSPHAVAPRALPFDHSITRQHGNLAVTWYGPEPRVIVNDAKLMREILGNKHAGVFGKQKSVLWVERLLANGLTTHQGEKWATHRRIINHAFHLEKLKVTSLHTTSIYLYWLTVCCKYYRTLCNTDSFT